MNPALSRKVFVQFTVLLFTLSAFSVRSATLPAGMIDVVVASGFTNVSCMAIAPDGRVFVGQQNGLVRVVKNGAVLPAPFVSLGANSTNEHGLLGVILDPGFSSNNFVYVHYTTNTAVFGNVVQRVSRFVANGDVATPGSETALIETDLFTAGTELGGGLAFSPDGLLYIGIGQSGPSSNAQTTNSLYGKILRVQRDGTIPSDNPFFNVNTGKNRAVWALGLRNPYVIATERGTGRLFINDVGGSAREEVNHVVSGANYGWPTCEGDCAVPNPALRNPLYAFQHTNGFSVITGGTFYDPPVALFPTQYLGKYFFGDWITSTIFLMDPATTNVTSFASRLVGRLVSLQVGPDGALYYLVQSVESVSGVLVGGLVGKILPGAQTLFPLGSAWKYLDHGTTNLPASWTQLAFDDSAWSNGVAQLGYGDGGEATTIRSTGTNGTRIITTYFRKAFVPTNAGFSHFVVSLVRDDGGIVYLNGTEVFRSNMPTGAVTSATLAPIAMAVSGGVDDESATFGAIFNANLMVPGTNLLAVEIHQQLATSSDVSFDLALYGLSGAPALGAIAAGSNIILRYPVWASSFAVESVTNLPGTNWTAVATNGAVVVGSEVQLPVNADGGQKFFRLRSP